MGKGCGSEGVEGAGEPGVHLVSEDVEGVALEGAEHGAGADGLDVDDAVVALEDGDVAGEEEADGGLGGEGLGGEPGVAGAEDEVGGAVEVDLLLEGGLDVDLGEDAEALGGEGLPDEGGGAGDGVTRERAGDGVVARVIHDGPPLGVSRGCGGRLRGQEAGQGGGPRRVRRCGAGCREDVARSVANIASVGLLL